MKNWPILLPAALILGGLGAWGLSSWFSSSDPITPQGGEPALRAGESQKQPPVVVEGPAVGPAVKSPTRSLPTRSLPTGPTWTPRNPWYRTGGIGRKTPPPAKSAVIFPDGTWLPVLNGVKDAPPYPGFSNGYPYAPVTQIITDDKGLQWYYHADGTRSAPQNMKYSEGGKDLGTRSGWAIGNPHDKKPVVGPDGKIRYEPRKTPKPAIRTSPGG